MAVNPGYEDRLRMMAEQLGVQKQKGRTSAQPYKPTQQLLATELSRAGTPMLQGGGPQNVPAPTDPTKPMIGQGANTKSVQGGGFQKGGYGSVPFSYPSLQPNRTGPAPANPDAKLMMMAAERKPSVAHPPMKMPGAPSEQSMIAPAPQSTSAASPSPSPAIGNPRLGMAGEDRLNQIKRSLDAERGRASAMPKQYELSAMSPEQRLMWQTQKDAARGNVSELNSQGSTLSRAMNPVAKTLASDPAQAAQSQQAILKDTGAFGKYGPEPDLALRAKMLASEMGPRRQAVEAGDAKALADATGKEAVWQKSENEALDMADQDRKLAMLQKEAQGSAYNAQIAGNSPEAIKAAQAAAIARSGAETKAIGAQGDLAEKQAIVTRGALEQQGKTQQREADLSDPAMAPIKNAAANFLGGLNALMDSFVYGGTPVVGTDPDTVLSSLESIRQAWPSMTDTQRSYIRDHITANTIGKDPTRKTLSQLFVRNYTLGGLGGWSDGKMGIIKKAIQQIQDGTFGS